MKNKLIWKILGAYVSIIVIAVFMMNFFVGLKLQDYFESKISERLISNSFLVGKLLYEDLVKHDLNNIAIKINDISKNLNLRITVINKDGIVLGDSAESPDKMENHINRLEISRAIANGVGESMHFSDTLSYNMKYSARAIKKDGDLIGVVRLAFPFGEIESQNRVIYRVVLLGGIVTIFFVFIIGYFISRNIYKPISEMNEIAKCISKGDFTKRINIKNDDELGVLAKSLNKMADELKQKIDNLRITDQIRTDFVANVSHELKTPLTSIIGFIETLEYGALEDKENAKRFVSIIKKHAERISNIVNDLLTLSELESDSKNKIKCINFNLKEGLDEILLGFGHAIRAKKLQLKVDYIGDDFLINADKTKIEQVFVNIIDNAVKYTKQCGLIKILIKNTKEEFIIVVEDNGDGIPNEHLNRLFERFYRVDKARSSQLGGTGLGLSIVKHIVSLHKGTVNIESKVGLGTKVKVILPKI